MSWSDLVAADPGLAAHGAERLGAAVAFLATVDAAGAPRVHPVTPVVAPGRLFVFMEASSPKGHDLRRGSRYALHAGVEDDAGGRGEFGARGTGVPVDDPATRAEAVAHASYDPSDRYVLFELLVDEVLATQYDDDGVPHRRRWSH